VRVLGLKTLPPRLVHGTTLGRARRMRREPTDAERKMWTLLRDRRLCSLKFRRQHPVGAFIVDFCCVEHKLIVELDGGQRGERPRAEADARRTRYLRARGYRVIRLWNNDVLSEPHAALEVVLEALQPEDQAPSPSSSPAKKRERERIRAGGGRLSQSLERRSRAPHVSPEGSRWNANALPACSFVAPASVPVLLHDS